MNFKETLNAFKRQEFSSVRILSTVRLLKLFVFFIMILTLICNIGDKQKRKGYHLVRMY